MNVSIAELANLSVPTTPFMKVVSNGRFLMEPHVKGSFTLMDGTVVDANLKNGPISNDTYYITPNKCTECQGFHEEPQCAAVCPVDCCIPDDLYRETVDELMSKKEKLHI